MPTVEEAISGFGLQLLGSVDAPSPLMVPPPLFAKIQHWDREQAACAARKQEYMDLAGQLLEVDLERYRPIIDLDTGVVTLTPREADQS